MPATDVTPETNPPATPAPPPVPPKGDDALDPTLRMMFGIAESEASVEPVEEKQPRGRSIHEVLSEDEQPVPPPEPETTPAPSPEPAPPAAPAVPEEKPIRARKKTAEIPPAPTAPTSEAPKPAAAPPEPAPADESDLLEEERAQLELARVGERADPAKYAGKAAKLLKFFKEHKDYLAAAKRKDPNVHFDQDNEEYQSFLADNAVRFSPIEQENLRTAKIREEIRRENSEEISTVRDELFRNSQEPVIKQKADTYFGQLLTDGLSDEMKDAFKAAEKEKPGSGMTKLREDYALEFEASQKVFAAAANDMEEFMRLTTINPKTGRAITAFDKSNPTHERIVHFINATCKEFEETAGNARMKDGKRFVERDTFFKIPKEERTKYWTFSHQDIIDRAKSTAIGAVKQYIAAEYERLKKSGFERKPRAASPASPSGEPAAAPTASAPPAPRPAPIPSGGDPGNSSASLPRRLLLGED